MLSSALGFGALVLIFRFQSFREVIARGREHRRRESAAPGRARPGGAARDAAGVLTCESPVPTFCRHNRLIQNCPICSREQDVEPRPVVSPGAQRAGGPAGRAGRAGARRGRSARGGLGRPRGTRGDGPPARARGRRRLPHGLVPGLRSSADAERLADELAFAAARLELLAVDPPGLYAEVADPPATSRSGPGWPF